MAAGAARPGRPGWRDELHADYRARASPGSGPRPGIVNQELLAREAGRLAGAYEEAADRLRRLSLGSAGLALAVEAPGPEDVGRAGSACSGPPCATCCAASGPVAEVMEHRDRALERSLFSSAAQRALRAARDETDADAAEQPTAPRAAPGPAVAGGLRPPAPAAAAPPRRVRSTPAAVHIDSFAPPPSRPPLDDVLVRPAPDGQPPAAGHGPPGRRARPA